DERPAADSGEEYDRIEGVGHVEDTGGDEPARIRCAERSEDTCKSPERRELGQNSLEHRAAARAERSQHRALEAALVPARLDRGEQHGEPGKQREREYALHREHRLVHHRAHLREQIADVEDRDAREAVRELREHMARRRMEVRAREIRARRRIEYTGRKHDEEIRIEAIPFDFPNVSDRRRERLPAYRERQLIPDVQSEGLLKLRCDRYERLTEVLRPPPAT